MNFENKVVMITGSGSGMGEATAINFAKEGADVVIVDYNEESANNTEAKCKEFGKRVLVIRTDVSKDEDAKNAIEKTIKEFGKLDVLVNNAGIISEDKLVPGTIMDTYDQVMNTNLRAVVLMTSLATPYLIKSKGCIVNTASVAGIAAQKGSEYPAYTVSKAGVVSFTRLSALELAPFGVRVNAVGPGPVYTNLLTNAGINREFSEFCEATALKKNSDSCEIADLIVYLASSKAKSITGSTYVIDNGLLLM